MPVAMYIDPDGIVHMTHSASAGGLSEAEFMARASGWAGAIGPSHTVWITGASAPEVAGGRVHTVYGGVANTVWEWKDLNAPIELEGEPMQGPAAHDSASDKLDVFCTKRGIGKPMPLQAPKAILITNPSSYISGSSSAAPKAAPPIYRPPEAPPPPLGCPKPPTLISCSGCGVHGRLHGDGPFILRLASSCRQEEEGEGAWSMLAQRRLLAGYTFWCHKCDSTTQLMSKGACNDHKAKGYTWNSSSSKGWNGPRNQQIMIMGVDKAAEGTGFQEQSPMETQFQLIVDLTRKSNEHLDHLRSQQLLIETLRDKVNELETKIDDIHNFMHSEAVVTLLPGVTLRVDEATQTDREDEEWKGSRGPARRGSNESAIAEP